MSLGLELVVQEYERLTADNLRLITIWREKSTLQAAEITALKKQIVALEADLFRIGEFAVVDFDDVTVGEVDKVLPVEKRKTYADLLRRTKDTE